MVIFMNKRIDGQQLRQWIVNKLKGSVNIPSFLGSETEVQNIEEILKNLKVKLQRLWTMRNSTDCASLGNLMKLGGDVILKFP